MFSITDIKDELRLAYASQWAKNDPAHREEHFAKVFSAAVEIDSNLNLGHDPINMLFAAYMHDLFAHDREIHHVRSHDYVMRAKDPLLKKYLSSGSDRLAVANACLQHRASFTGEFVSEFAELINAADYMRPEGLVSLMDRARQYTMHQDPTLSADEVEANVIYHMREKFSRFGYAKYPTLYLKVYGEEVQSIYDEIDRL